MHAQADSDGQLEAAAARALGALTEQGKQRAVPRIATATLVSEPEPNQLALADLMALANSAVELNATAWGRKEQRAGMLAPPRSRDTEGLLWVYLLYYVGGGALFVFFGFRPLLRLLGA